MKHTPGPWWFAQHDAFGRYDVGEGDAVLFRSVPRADSGPGEAPLTQTSDAHQAANARLIAAAPDLLEALRRMVNCMTQDDLAHPLDACMYGPQCNVCQAKVAINKATGEAAP